MAREQLTAQEKRLLDTVDHMADDMTDFLARLVAEPSVLGMEQGALEVMEVELSKLGFAPERKEIDPEFLADKPGFAPVPWSYEGRYNLAAVKPAAGEGGKSALFNGHLDVVSPEPVEYWDTEPFSPVVRDGWMIGRGAGDMKGGVAAMTYAAAAVDKAGFGLAAPLTLEAVIEEECCGNGALSLFHQGYDAEAVFIPEPFGPTLYAEQVGVLWFKVQVEGASAHVLETKAGSNAVEKLFPLIHALRELEDAMNREPRPKSYEGFEHPLNLNVGVIKGGDWPSTVPAKAEFHARLSYYPGQRFEHMAKRVEATIAGAAARDPWLSKNPPKVEFYGFRSDGHATPMNDPALTAMAQCHQALTGKEIERYVSTCTTDLRVFALYGQGHCACYGPVARSIHGVNEAVDLASVQHVARTYALFLARWCGLVE